MLIRKPWSQWSESFHFKDLPGAMGIYEIAGEEQKTIYIGLAGGASPFGLRGELFRLFAKPEQMAGWNWQHPHPEGVPASLKEQARYFRYEVNHQYYSRWIEALTRFREDYGELPPINQEVDKGRIPTLGRYHWKSQGL